MEYFSLNQFVKTFCIYQNDEGSKHSFMLLLLSSFTQTFRCHTYHKEEKENEYG